MYRKHFCTTQYSFGHVEDERSGNINPIETWFEQQFLYIKPQEMKLFFYMYMFMCMCM